MANNPTTTTLLTIYILCFPGLLSASCSSRLHDGLERESRPNTRSALPPGCFNGICREDGTCECNPCWSGSTCQEYVDRFSPRFLAEEPFFMVNPGSGENQVPLFRLESGDDDLGLTCQLGQVGPAATCPCATPRYKVVGPSQSVFRADQETGDVFIKSGYSLRPGQQYIISLQVAALEVNATGYKAWAETLSVDLWVKSPEEASESRPSWDFNSDHYSSPLIQPLNPSQLRKHQPFTNRKRRSLLRFSSNHHNLQNNNVDLISASERRRRVERSSTDQERSRRLA